MRKYINILYLFLAVNYYLPTLALNEANNTITSNDNVAIDNDDIVIAGDSIVTMQDLCNENIPLIVINTVNGEEPACDFVNAPEGSFGIGITNVTKVHGGMYIIFGNDTIYNSGDYEKDTSGMTIKIRGNTSAYFFQYKPPYKLKLQKKADLFCRGNDDVYKDKEWVLLHINKHDFVVPWTGFTLSKIMNYSWVPSFEYANVVMNGTYRGIYILVESVKRNAKCRIDVDEESGYIIENDAYWWNEDLYFNSSFLLNYTFKYPDSEDVTDEQLEYIQNAVNNMEASFYDGTYPEFIDIFSFACWMLVHDILGTSDSAGTNMFISKYDSAENSKFKLETPWDFDGIQNRKDLWATIHSESGFFFRELFNSTNTEFTKEYIRIWKERGDEIINKMIEKLDSLEQSDLTTVLDYYCQLDNKIHYQANDSVAVQIESDKQWFIDRKTWLDIAIAELEEETGISIVPYSYPTNSDALYDLQGRKVLYPTRGIYIQNGKKYIWK